MAVKFAKKYNLTDKIGDLAHRYLGVDPDTGKILGSLAGNLIFGTGGKDNVLNNLGKVVLDKIVTGKWKRNVSIFYSRLWTGVFLCVLRANLCTLYFGRLLIVS